MSTIAIIDGEHYLPVIVEALGEIRQKETVAAAVFAGGTEKVADDADLSMLGCPVFAHDDAPTALRQALKAHPAADRVIDLSDEPVLDYVKRFALISVALHAGLSYRGADFNFDPPGQADIAAKPSLAIIGTGKRVGKTAISGYIARHLKSSGYQPIVVAMGRGGPPEPEVVAGDKIDIDAGYLLGISSRGLHAASDYYEDALTSRVTTVGCRRCGGGMAGAPFISNVPEGVRIANDLPGDFLLLEGSGATLPPVQPDARLVVCAANQPGEYIVGYLGAYRLLISDVALIANCEEEVIEPAQVDALAGAMFAVNPGLTVLPTVFRPQPLEDISGADVFFATTAPEWVIGKLTRHIESVFGARVVGVSNNLSNRPALRADLARAGGRFDVLLTEIKAAAVDVATRLATESGARVIYCDNVPEVVFSDADLAEEVKKLGELTRKRFQTKQKHVS